MIMQHVDIDAEKSGGVKKLGIGSRSTTSARIFVASQLKLFPIDTLKIERPSCATFRRAPTIRRSLRPSYRLAGARRARRRRSVETWRSISSCAKTAATKKGFTSQALSPDAFAECEEGPQAPASAETLLRRSAARGLEVTAS